MRSRPPANARGTVRGLMNRPMTLLFACVLGCAHSPGASNEAPTPASPRVPQPVNVVVRAMDKASIELLPSAVAQARDELIARGHSVREDADILLEIDLGPTHEAGASGRCTRLAGRVVRGGQRFAAVEFAGEQCGNNLPQVFPSTSTDAFTALAEAGLAMAFRGEVRVEPGLTVLLSRLSTAAMR